MNAQLSEYELRCVSFFALPSVVNRYEPSITKASQSVRQHIFSHSKRRFEVELVAESTLQGKTGNLTGSNLFG